MEPYPLHGPTKTNLTPSNEAPEAPSDGPVFIPISTFATSDGLHVARYALPLDQIPADFYADPDGSWTFEALVAAAGFSVDQGIALGALREAFNDHPDGSAVVTLNAESRPYIAIIECPIAYRYVAEASTESSAA